MYVFPLKGLCSPFKVIGDTSVSLRRIWTTLGGNSSYNPTEASYTAQGLQKQPAILKHLLFRYYREYKDICFGTWILDSRPLGPALWRIFYVESEFKVNYLLLSPSIENFGKTKVYKIETGKNHLCPYIPSGGAV